MKAAGRAAGVIATVAAALLAFGLVTWAALESQEVGVLHTRAPDGSPRRTRLWIARDGGGFWLEAATPERGWYRDVLHDAEVELEVAGERRPLSARPDPGREAHLDVRRRLREKYGWADAWVAMIQDTSQSIAVRLDPRTQGEAR